MIVVRLAIVAAGIFLFALSLAPLAAFAYTGEFIVHSDYVDGYVNVTLVYNGIVPLKNVNVTISSNGDLIASNSAGILKDGGSVTLLIPVDRLTGNITLTFHASIAGIYEVNYEVEYNEAPGG